MTGKKQKKSAAVIGMVLHTINNPSALKPWSEYLAGVDPWKGLEVSAERLLTGWTHGTAWRIFAAADPKSAKNGGAEQFDNQSGVIIFVPENGRALAEGILKAPLPAELGDGGFIQLIGTKMRHKGEVKYLLSAAERVISEKNKRVFFFLPEGNAAALRFYKGLGYEEAGKAADLYKPGHAEILLTRKLED